MDKEHAMSHLLYSNPVFLRIVLISLFLFAWTGCSEDDNIVDINGYWSGLNTNSTTNKSWPFDVYFELRGENISGIYTDYHGSFSFRNPFYDGDTIRFVIDIYPDSITYVGDRSGNNKFTGTWSHSGTGNNGEWTLLRDF
jgi:hypothetical protein